MVGREFLCAYQSVNAAVLKFWIVVVLASRCVQLQQQLQDLRRLKDVW
jgi:hypothetical protein